jgi:pyruvate,orthophosphate dikinase
MPTRIRPSQAGAALAPRGTVRDVAEARSEYTSARTIGSNIEHRLAGTTLPRHPGYVAPEIDYVLDDGTEMTVSVRDSDVRYLDRVPHETALDHVDLIHRARRGDPNAAAELDRRTAATSHAITARFAGRTLTDNEYVIPYTSAGRFTEDQVSHKGSILLSLSQKGFATADFTLLSAGAIQLTPNRFDQCVHDAIADLEILSGRQLGNPDNPLLIALRSAMPAYIPGFMPTYLNVGLTPAILPGLPSRYGEDGAARIRLNSRRTLMEALDPDAYALIEPDIRPDLARSRTDELSEALEALIARRAPHLLTDTAAQIRFFLDKAYRFYFDHLDVLRNFMIRDTHYPAVIVQRMVCSVIDDRSYAGILYSRHPRRGKGVFLQYANAVFGEELMTGRLAPQERHFSNRDEARRDFPAVYHFWPRLFQLEDIFGGPVMVEFTGVHGTFTILQVNAAELSGSGMLTAVMDMHRAGSIPATRVRELIKPYHVRQIESDAIDPRSIQMLEPFGRGVPVLPRSAVTGRLSFSVEPGASPTRARGQAAVILAKARFTPQDAMDMQKVGGICSLSPAAIHVVTTAQNLGIPALLNLERDGVRIDLAGRRLVNAGGRELREGDWVTISSRKGTLYAGKAVFAPARLLRMMAGEQVDLTETERPRFEQLAVYYREYRRILEGVDATGFESLQDLGHAIRYGELRDQPDRASQFVNQCFDRRGTDLVGRLLETTLGMHLINLTAFALLSLDRKARLFQMAAEACSRRGLSGYRAGAFVVGSLVEPRFSVPFWNRLRPHEVAFLINEWVLHQKYLDVIEQIGEKRIRQAKDVILSTGLRSLPSLEASVAAFMPLKLSRISLEHVRRALPDGGDSQSGEFIDLLLRPFGAFFDYRDPQSLAGLQRICEAEGIPVPGPEDR